MRFRPIGRSGLQASVIAFGGGPIGGGPWGEVSDSQALEAIDVFLSGGVNLIDTAPVYGFGRSEELIGRSLAGRRNNVLIATKCGLVWHDTKGTPFAKKFSGRSVYRHLSKESVRYELEQSLRRLRTEYVDLYQTHWQDSTTPIEETMQALLQLKQEGKIRAIGVSNCSVEELYRYRSIGPIDSAQEKFNMLNRRLSRDVLPACVEHNLAVLAYMPLAEGLLTGKVGPEREFPPEDLRYHRAEFAPQIRARVHAMLQSMHPMAERYGVTLSQLVLAWTLAQTGVTHTLVGVRTKAQARENAKAGGVMLDAEDLEILAGLLRNHGFDGNGVGSG
jgi:methylglyoxal reductase